MEVQEERGCAFNNKPNLSATSTVSQDALRMRGLAKTPLAFFWPSFKTFSVLFLLAEKQVGCEIQILTDPAPTWLSS